MTAIPIQLSVRPPQPAESTLPAEWPDEAWRASMLEGNWRPDPFRQFVLKLHNRCNLACDYCYIYEMADQSWRTLPQVMDRRTLAQAARRIGEHAATHGLDLVHVIYHGGEPLLVGADYIDYASETIRDAVPAGTSVVLSVQTNGVLLDERMLGALSRHDIGVGVSIDGDQAGNDRHRRYANGKGSYHQIAEGLRRLNQPAYRRLFSMLLCTIDVTNDPVATYESLLEFDPPGIDFLHPHGNWSERPPHRGADPRRTPYGDWLAAVFDRWYGAPVQETHVRILQAIVDETLGRRGGYDAIGLVVPPMIEVETDGSMQQNCNLKSTYEGATCTGLNVYAHDFDLATEHPMVSAGQAGLAALAAECQECPIRDVCGGGYFPHRYRAGSGFRHPSVYCADLFRLITHIQRRVHADLGQLLPGGTR